MPFNDAYRLRLGHTLETNSINHYGDTELGLQYLQRIKNSKIPAYTVLDTSISASKGGDFLEQNGYYVEEYAMADNAEFSSQFKFSALFGGGGNIGVNKNFFLTTAGHLGYIMQKGNFSYQRLDVDHQSRSIADSQITTSVVHKEKYIHGMIMRLSAGGVYLFNPESDPHFFLGYRLHVSKQLTFSQHLSNPTRVGLTIYCGLNFK